jgi:hypothetical protein
MTEPAMPASRWAAAAHVFVDDIDAPVLVYTPDGRAVVVVLAARLGVGVVLIQAERGESGIIRPGVGARAEGQDTAQAIGGEAVGVNAGSDGQADIEILFSAFSKPYFGQTARNLNDSRQGAKDRQH